MKVSCNWLKSIINHNLEPETVAVMLTASGLEVEGMETFESVPGGLKGLVVGHVMECGKHPDADRLSLTKVDIGKGEPLSIVCGAPNVAAGQKVIVATVGTKLYPSSGEPFEIKKSKIRGAVSEGMICAEDEIGLGASHAGIMVLPDETPVGMAAAEYFNVETDTILEIGLTPNRSDAASHLGVARDLLAIINSAPGTGNKAEVHLHGLNPLPEASGLEEVTITVEDPKDCPRYSGIVISSVTVKESPSWLKTRLQSIGIRPINNVVDITNFVLHETGQPLHAFDTEKIKGKKIVVRKAIEGEVFVTLDGVERKLKSGDLMICNESQPMCIAGVFGGIESGVTEKTGSVFLESACFDAGAVRRSAKNHGLKTDASFRFERGTDPEMTITALVRATHLILQEAGGIISMGLKDVYPEKLEPYKIAFSYNNCDELIGKEIDRGTIKNIIQNLGIGIENEGNDALLLHVPRFKTDVTREADVIEEVMRIYGYNNVEVSKTISFSTGIPAANVFPALENKAGSVLESFGFSEIMSLSLTRESHYPEPEGLVKLLNPLSQELNVLRADMIYSGLEAIAYNINRKQTDLKFFEFGKTYKTAPDSKHPYEENKQLSLFVTGRLFGLNPYGMNQEAGFAYLRSALNNFLVKLGAKNWKQEESAYSNFSSGLIYTLNNKTLAEIGTVSKRVLKQFDIVQDVFYACINSAVLAKAFSSSLHIEFEELPKFPSVRRDLALLIDRSVNYKQIEELAYSTERKLLREVNLFDIYESEKLGNKKSYAVSFTLQNNDATLTDKQIESVMEKLVKSYKEKLGAELR